MVQLKIYMNSVWDPGLYLCKDGPKLFKEKKKILCYENRKKIFCGGRKRK